MENGYYELDLTPTNYRKTVLKNIYDSIPQEIQNSDMCFADKMKFMTNEGMVYNINPIRCNAYVTPALLNFIRSELHNEFRGVIAEILIDPASSNIRIYECHSQ
jgi:hypothetical protein